MNEEIFQLWLTCHTKEEIAGKMAITKKILFHFLSFMKKN